MSSAGWTGLNIFSETSHILSVTVFLTFSIQAALIGWTFHIIYGFAKPQLMVNCQIPEPLLLRLLSREEMSDLSLCVFKHTDFKSFSCVDILLISSDGYCLD